MRCYRHALISDVLFSMSPKQTSDRVWGGGGAGSGKLYANQTDQCSTEGGGVGGGVGWGVEWGVGVGAGVVGLEEGR